MNTVSFFESSLKLQGYHLPNNFLLPAAVYESPYFIPKV